MDNGGGFERHMGGRAAGEKSTGNNAGQGLGSSAFISEVIDVQDHAAKLFSLDDALMAESGAQLRDQAAENEFVDNIVSVAEHDAEEEGESSDGEDDDEEDYGDLEIEECAEEEVVDADEVAVCTSSQGGSLSSVPSREQRVHRRDSMQRGLLDHVVEDQRARVEAARKAAEDRATAFNAERCFFRSLECVFYFSLVWLNMLPVVAVVWGMLCSGCYSCRRRSIGN